MSLQKYATGWYLCSGCKSPVDPENAEVMHKRQEAYCEKCILQGENHQ